MRTEFSAETSAWACGPASATLINRRAGVDSRRAPPPKFTLNRARLGAKLASMGCAGELAGAERTRRSREVSAAAAVVAKTTGIRAEIGGQSGENNNNSHHCDSESRLVLANPCASSQGRATDSQDTQATGGDIPRSQIETRIAMGARAQLTPDSRPPDRRRLRGGAHHHDHDDDDNEDDDYHRHHHPTRRHHPSGHDDRDHDQHNQHPRAHRNDHWPAWVGCRRPIVPATSARNALPLVALAVISFLVAGIAPAAQAVDCFKCSSRNGSNPACEDPFHNLNTTRINSPILPDPQPAVIYHTPCYAGKKGREGLFPASACIKLTGVFDTTGETLVVRHCALDSGTLTQDTELARMSHCGKFQFEGDLLRGCVLACPEDACNSARSLITLGPAARLVVAISLVFALIDLIGVNLRR